MKVFIALLKKEYLESIRNKKLFIMFFIFLFLGILGPVTAKISPEILKSFLGEELAKGLQEPTFIDSWAQFFKNVTQLGFIFIAIIFSNYIVNEFSKKTLVNLVAKGLPRFQIVISKIFFASILWTVSFIIYCLIFNLYTNYIFKENVEILLAIKASIPILIFGIFLLTLECFAGFVFRNTIGALSTLVITIALQFLIGMYDKIAKFLPMFLLSDNINVIKEIVSFTDYKYSILTTILLTILMIFTSIFVLNRKEI
ncbi:MULTISPECIES: hypothetical protein [unclassified Parvimonas]|uniref:hypothetical protein n=1 Tax=unclassified Parvimonas TaxID=1151464 RepID=UPI002B4A7DD0|nr:MULTISPECIES: hypothetical protein [unclassified Parvimonas]MEB3025177.1 hypothetical protein [Parvimonas sp. M13]MEB3089173.1 hypothetical protein [Parvimonas sp. M20]